LKAHRNHRQVNDQNAFWENRTGGSINVTAVRVGRAGGNELLVRKSTGAIGAAKLLKVMPSVDYYDSQINSNNTGANGLTSLITNFATALSASGHVSALLKDEASTLNTALQNTPALGTLLNTPNNTSGANNAPKAYLNIVFFDEQLKYDGTSSVVVPVRYNVNTKATISKMAGSAVLAKKSGYVYVYVSNESDEMVYFDNFLLLHERGPLLEETHYYPFGLTMAGISSKALGKVANKYKFNGIESSEDFDIKIYDAFYPNLDPQIGKFMQIDPEADDLLSYSPYDAMGNNPISNVDPLGNFRTWFGAFLHRLVHGGGSIKKNEFGEWYVNKYKNSTSADGTPVVSGFRYYGEDRNQYSSAGEERAIEDELVDAGLFERNNTQQEANEKNLKAFVGANLPECIKSREYCYKHSKNYCEH
jgi:RHS repeat-associated protein